MVNKLKQLGIVLSIDHYHCFEAKMVGGNGLELYAEMYA